MGDCSTYSASTGALAGVSVLYAGTNRAFEFVFDLGDYYGDIRKLVFRQARHGTPNGNNRGFEVMLIQVSDDGVNWTRAKGTLSAVAVPNAVELEDMQGETTNVEHYDFTYTLDSVAKAKYVRVILSNDGGYVLQLEEIEIRN